MISLTWEQVNSWRLRQHCLSQRLKAEDFLQAVRQTMGIHAQVMSAAEMAIEARVEGLSPQHVEAALWKERSLVKTWLMRQTLHLVPTTDYPTYIAARRITNIDWPALFSRNGVDGSIFDAYLATADDILNDQPQTRQQFVKAVGERLKSIELRKFLIESWGTAFKPLAWNGELCCGPNNGQNVTFVRPRAWIGSWQEVEPEAALQEITRRYLMAYGPTKPRNFQVWWWMSGKAAKHAFNSIADETEEVDVEGWRSTALKASVQPMLEMKATGKVHLLPAFDAFTVGLPRDKNLDRLIASENRRKVYRLQGWVSAVVLVDGFIKGTWELKVMGSRSIISVNLFSQVSNGIKEGIAVQAEWVGKLLNTNLEIVFA